MAPKLLVLDLDGTLLTHERKVTEADREAALALRDAGVVVTIATGRLFPGTKRVAETIGVRGPVAVMNGVEVLDAATGAPAYAAYLDAGEAAELRAALDDHGFHPFLFASEGVHYGAGADHLAPYLGVWSEQLHRYDDVAHAPWETHPRVVSVSGAGPLHRAEAARAAVRRRLRDQRVAVEFQTFFGDAFFEVRAAEDKGTAIARLAAHHGATVDDVVAVGDWINDLPMLRAAGRSFAVAHAHPDAKAAAKEHLDATRDGGVVVEVARRVWGL